MIERILETSSLRFQIWLKRSLASARESEMVTSSGLIVGQTREFDFNMANIFESHKMATRGLFYDMTRTPLPFECQVSVQHIPWSVAPDFIRGTTKGVDLRINSLGNNVVTWTVHPIAGRGPHEISVLICYYNWVLFHCCTGHTATTIESSLQQLSSAPEVASEVLTIGRRKLVVPNDANGNPILPQRWQTKAD